MSQAGILIVEDESIVQVHLQRIVERVGYEVTGVAASAQEAIDVASKNPPDLVLMDIELRGERDGIEAARELRSMFDVAIVFLTAYADELTVQRTEAVGAVGYIVKPFSEGEVRAVVATALGVHNQLRELRHARGGETVAAMAAAPRTVTETFQGMSGRSPAMRRVFERIVELAGIDWTVLIEGETGTGKEMAARAIHELSARADKAFVAVNCAGLTDSLLSSQLFGHRRGAFTGAVDDQQGLFEAANEGVLLLDEIADVSTGVQKALLRVLEDRMLRRVGETQTRHVDVRIVSATQRNLADEVDSGRFRADLLFRLRAARLRLPPLRERGNDIGLLAETFIRTSARSANRPVERISDEATKYLYRYRWPGNVRELKNTIDHAVLACSGSTIEVAHLPPEVLSAERGGEAAVFSSKDERERILEALRTSGGNRARAARLLGISRATLYRRLSTLGIDDA